MVTGTLADMIEAQYESMGSLAEKLGAAAVGVQGSGWAWLAYDKVNKRLAITTCANQVNAARPNEYFCGVRDDGSVPQAVRAMMPFRKRQAVGTPTR